MVYTELVLKQQQFHVALAMQQLYQYITLVDIKNMCYKSIVTHSESHTP